MRGIQHGFNTIQPCSPCMSLRYEGHYLLWRWVHVTCYMFVHALQASKMQLGFHLLVAWHSNNALLGSRWGNDASCIATYCNQESSLVFPSSDAPEDVRNVAHPRVCIQDHKTMDSASGRLWPCIFGVATSSLCHECWPKKTQSHYVNVSLWSSTGSSCDGFTESLGCRRKPLSLQGCRSMPIMPMAVLWGTEHLCAWSNIGPLCKPILVFEVYAGSQIGSNLSLCPRAGRAFSIFSF